MEPIWTTAPFALVAAYTPSSCRPGRIKSYRLRFNLDGRPKGKAAPANLHPDPGAEVWGVLYRITRRDLLRLDSTEGVPGRGYLHVEIEAEDRNGRVVQAVTYMAQGNEVDGKPSLRYITLLRDGARAHGLPETHIQFLEGVDHVQWIGRPIDLCSGDGTRVVVWMMFYPLSSGLVKRAGASTFMCQGDESASSVFTCEHDWQDSA